MSFDAFRKKLGSAIAGPAASSGSQADQAQKTGKHSALPVDPYPYPGLKFAFHFITIDVTNIGRGTTGLVTGQTMVTSDITSQYHKLSEAYGQGFVLETFKDVPGVGKMGWNASESPYQAIYSRPCGGPVYHSWQLLVVKSSINTVETAGLLDSLAGRTHDVSNKSGIINQIAKYCRQGGRLVCVELTGQKQSSGITGSLIGKGNAMGCDVFFNIPRHPNPTMYTYQLINVPVQIMYFGPGKMVKVTCDWMQHFARHLQQGWRLAEIFWDQGKRSHGDFTLSGDHNSVWFFEKETAHVNNLAPVYEGIIVEYFHTVKLGFFQTKAKGDWAPVISEMGSRGWELACMLETPEVTNIGLGNMTFKVLFFFQRRIVQGYPAPPPQGAYGQAYAAPPPQGYAPPPQNYPAPGHGGVGYYQTHPSGGPNQAPPPYNPNYQPNAPLPPKH